MVHKKLSLLIAVFAITGITILSTPVLAKAMDGNRTGMSEDQKQAVTDRRAAIEEKLTTMKAERTAKLDTKRLEVCQKRQQKINDITVRGTQQNKKQLAVFQKIEENVKQFYINKNLFSDAYADVVADADSKEAAAVAAIEASSETTFDCTTTDGAKPGNIIKAAMTARHTALKEYRTAVKNLIVVVKKANGEQKTVNDTPAPVADTATTNSTREQ